VSVHLALASANATVPLRRVHIESERGKAGRVFGVLSFA
jgi:hypothetical protein